MSATLTYEPDQLPAGLLALAVHVAFFSLLYFGFTWQTQPARMMSVELWRSLPEVEIAPPTVPKITEAMQPAQPVQPLQPEKLTKPDIVLPDKMDKKKVETKSTQQIQLEQKQEKAEQRERIAAEQAAQRAAEAARESAEQAARKKAVQDAAVDAMVNEYKAKIITKIRRNIVKPPDVRDDARAEFRVTLLPGGTVLTVELKRSSGNAAYDNAVERAILKSQPLPLPADMAMFNRFRVLLLVFRPVE
ncbi:MAG: cell envelope integrity protein TolA [Pseudomonadota bacterium]